MNRSHFNLHAQFKQARRSRFAKYRQVFRINQATRINHSTILDFDALPHTHSLGLLCDLCASDSWAEKGKPRALLHRRCHLWARFPASSLRSVIRSA